VFFENLGRLNAEPGRTLVGHFRSHAGTRP
jgi:hypothetical protein